MLVRNRDIGCALVKACNLDADSDAVQLAGAATIVRKDTLKKISLMNLLKYMSKDSLPAFLLALVSMILILKHR